MTMDLKEPVWAESLDQFVRGTAIEQVQRGVTLSREKDDDDQVLVLDAGVCVALKFTAGGHQQSVAFYVAGDMLNPESLILGKATATIVAVTPVSFRRITHARLRAWMNEDEVWARDFWRRTASRSVLAQEWILSLGRRPAFERTAHLLCEYAMRTRTATGSGDVYAFPFTQVEFSDLLGLSVVHVNRTLQRLRHDGYIRLRRGTLQILKWSELKALAGFDPFYLTLIEGA